MQQDDPFMMQNDPATGMTDFGLNIIDDAPNSKFIEDALDLVCERLYALAQTAMKSLPVS